jgi:hypothetical protein
VSRGLRDKKGRQVMKRKKWNDADAQAFADGARTRAQTHANKKRERNKRECRGYRWRGVE